MSDYSRRNRGKSNNDDFDWESFDRKTSASSTYNNSDAPLRRRRTTTDGRRRRTENSAVAEKTVSTSERTAAVSGKKRRKRKKNLTEKQIKFRKRLRMSVLITILVLVVVTTGMFVGMYAAVSREIKDLNIKNLALNHTSEMYYLDKNGEYVKLEALESDKKQTWISSEEISPYFKEAIVAIEDERFYEHNGVDIKRTFGATVQFLASKVGLGDASYGGSTITQQVIKNVTKEDDVKATRKVKEIMRALAIEKEISKDEILTLYCNIVYFANNCYGIEAASKTYFNKTAAELNLQEAAAIAGITQYPTLYDPIAYPENNIEKRNTVLKKMYELGRINESEYNSAVSSPLELSGSYKAEKSKPNSYFADQVINDIINDLVEQKNYTLEFATSQVYNGGYKIYTTVDKDIQTAMESVFENTSNFPTGTDLQAAMAVIDPYTGEIKGLIGGLGKKTDIRGWNRATMSYRQPGSAIKPLAVYGPAVDLGKITEADIVTDEKITIGNDDWQPKNSYSGFKGNMTIKEAVARSANIPAVKVLDSIGLSNSFGYLQNKFHLSHITEEDRNYSSLALGGLTKGVSVKEMASAYGVFVNNGRYITPYTYTRVEDSNGNVILENHINEMQAMSESAAYITANLLSGPVNLSYGTATSAKLSSGVPTYGKTGTTDDDFDKWFVGFTPDYVGAVWFGFDEAKSLKKAGISGNPCVTAWNLVFEKVSRNPKNTSLVKPYSVTEEDICAISGKLAGRSCESVKAYFVDGTQPKSVCVNHYDRKQSDIFIKGDGADDENQKPKSTAKPSEEKKEDDDSEATVSPTAKPTSESGTGASTGSSSANGGATSGSGNGSGTHSGSHGATGGSESAGTAGGNTQSGTTSSGGAVSGGESAGSGGGTVSGGESSGTAAEPPAPPEESSAVMDIE